MFKAGDIVRINQTNELVIVYRRNDSGLFVLGRDFGLTVADADVILEVSYSALSEQNRLPIGLIGDRFENFQSILEWYFNARSLNN